MTIERHKASIMSEYGFVLIDKDNHTCYRTSAKHNQANHDSCTKFLASDAYKAKQSVYWPTIRGVKSSHPCSLPPPHPYLPLEKDIDVLNSRWDINDRMLYEVEYLPHIIHVTEMAPAQILESVIFLCDVLSYLIKNSHVANTHIWNVVLRNGSPFLIDIGDFWDLQATKHYPFLTDVTTDPIINLFNPSVVASDLKWREANKHVYDAFANGAQIHEELSKLNTSGEQWLQEARSILTKATIKDSPSFWDDYNELGSYDQQSVEQECHSHKKGAALCSFIDQVSPRTLTDLGCNTGIYSFYAAYKGCKTVGIDNCPNAISKANKMANKHNASSSFAYLDLFNDNPVEMYEYGKPPERFSSEMVIAPALIHHMFRKEGDIQKIINKIISYGDTAVAIEYIPHNDIHINKASCDWYSLQQITDALEQNNYDVAIKDSEPDGRKWLFATRSDSK